MIDLLVLQWRVFICLETFFSFYTDKKASILRIVSVGELYLVSSMKYSVSSFKIIGKLKIGHEKTRILKQHRISKNWK